MTRALLRPHANVEILPQGYNALTSEPWLELDLPRFCGGGSWVQITYRTSYLDPLMRPVIRFDGKYGEEWELMRAPLFGRASWVGRIPDGTGQILISPVAEPGRFFFEIEDVKRIFAPGLLLRAFRNDRKTAAMCIGARLINARRETRQALMFARGGVPFAQYSEWQRNNSCKFAPQGVDAPRRPADQLPHIRVVVTPRSSESIGESALWRSLLKSSYRNWSMTVLSGHIEERTAHDRLHWLAPQISLGALTESLAPDDLVIFVDPAVEFLDLALPCVGEFAARHPDADMIYGDHQEVQETGTVKPVLKPDWSPRLQAALDYVGPTLWIRARALRDTQICDLPAATASLHLQFPGLSHRIAHLRRIVATLPYVREIREVSRLSENNDASVAVSIIIPNKDQLTLVRTCIDGLLLQTGYKNVEIIIVDNDSGIETWSFYRSLPASVRILQAPGRFNFSIMCNKGAKEAGGRCLVFLNNDIEIIDRDWLGPLVAEAMQPQVGAVGARLLFPSGRVQHAGVTVGMGGYADHICQGLAADDPGYLGRLRATHEVSAVTGACLAVEAAKFWAVGGFDGEHLPVELNDIDLCLKLGARGWQTLMCPGSKLIHHQSATRGFAFRPFERYGRERAAFRARWAAVIRDDPYFHPALSLYSVDPALDG